VLQIDDADEGAAFEASVVTAAKKLSTAFSNEAQVVVKWKVTPGWRSCRLDIGRARLDSNGQRAR
jgi:hypothetical protein